MFRNGHEWHIIDYTDPPYRSAIWETRELISPWIRGSYGDPNIVDEDVALAAVARDFSLAGRKQDEVKVAYDTARGSETKTVRCFIVARSIEGSREKIICATCHSGWGRDRRGA